MVVKDVVGRPRHIVFRVRAKEAPTRKAMGQAIRALASGRLGAEAVDAAKPHLTIFDGEYGALRVRHTYRDDFARILATIRWVGGEGNAAVIEPLATSGTLKGARRLLERERRRVEADEQWAEDEVVRLGLN